MLSNIGFRSTSGWRALALIAAVTAFQACSSSGKPKAPGETGGDTGETGGTGGSSTPTGGSKGAAGSGGSKGSAGSGGGGEAGASGGSSGGGSGGASGGEGGGSGGASGGSGGASGGSGGSAETPDAAADAKAMSSSDGGYKLDPKSPIVACNGGYNLQGVTADDFCSFYEMYCMYDPTGMAKNPSGTALPAGTGSWFYKDRADCIMRYDMASMPAKGCRAGQLCKNKAGGCTHATGHFSNCP